MRAGRSKSRRVVGKIVEEKMGVPGAWRTPFRHEDPRQLLREMNQTAHSLGDHSCARLRVCKEVAACEPCQATAGL
jgi:hypothetical protein